MAIHSNDAFVDAIQKARLLEQGQLDELIEGLQERFPEPRALARHLLQQGWVTPYQVNQLLQGKGQELLLGQYLITERLGEGGMGQVFKARHLHLHRVVALKVIRKEHLAHPDAIRRFRREIQAAAQLSHPNIVMAYDADQVGNTHIFVMEYVDGIDLSTLLKQCGAPALELSCDYMRQAALGLQHAFERGMVHRDIKPANLLLTRVPAAGQTTPINPTQPRAAAWPPLGAVVKILDMGLARIHQPDAQESMSALTKEGRVVGTPDYMAPEQAVNPHTIDIRADLYSLGCTFYQMVTGQVPFVGGTMMEKLLHHRFDMPEPIERLRPAVPPEIRAIVFKLLAKKPEERYQTPGQLAQALTVGNGQTESIIPVAELPPRGALDTARFGTSETPPMAIPIAAPVPPPSLLKQWRWPIIAGLAGILVLAVVLLAVSLSRPSRNRGETKQADPVTSPLDPFRSRLAQKADPDKLRADLLAFAVKHRGTAEGREAIELLTQLPSALDHMSADNIPGKDRWPNHPRELVGIVGEQRLRHWGSVRSVAFSPRGNLLASGGEDFAIRLWGPPALREKAVLRGHANIIGALAFSPNGRTLASAAWDGTVRLWTIPDGPVNPRPLVLPLRPGNSYLALAFAQDGKLLACADGTNVQIWDLSGAQPKRHLALPDHAKHARALAFRADGKVLVSSDGLGTLRLWDLSDDLPVPHTLPKRHSEPVDALVLSPDGKTLITGGSDAMISLWDVDGTEVRERAVWRGLGGPILALALSPDGRRLASGGGGAAGLRLWDLGTDKRQEGVALKGHGGGVTCVSFSPDGQMLASGSNDTTVRLWELRASPPQERPQLGGPAGRVYALACSPDGKTVATCAGDPGVLRLWDLSGPKPQSRVPLRGANSSVFAAAFSPDGRYLAAGGGGGFARLWDLTSPPGTEPTVLKGQGSAVTTMAFAPDGLLLAAGGYDPAVRLWDMTGGERFALVGHSHEVTALAFAPDGKTLLTAARDRTLRLWDLTQPRPVGRIVLDNMPWIVYSLAFVLDGRTVITGSSDGGLRAWHVAPTQLRPVREFASKHGQAVTGVALAPDGGMLVSTGTDGQLIEWRMSSGKDVRRWQWDGPIRAVAFAPDGRHVITGNANGSLYIVRLR
jgi:WD40 repeat protein/serine/threonine protein kinase